MATVCSHCIEPANRSKYNWDSWLDGRTWTLEKGVDFTQPLESFRIYVYTTAGKRGINVSTRRINEKDGRQLLVIQAAVEYQAQTDHP